MQRIILSICILCLYLMCLCLSGAAAMRVARTERRRNGVIFSLGLSLLFKMDLSWHCFFRSNFFVSPLNVSLSRVGSGVRTNGLARIL